MIIGTIALFMLLFGAAGIDTLFSDLAKKEIKHAVGDPDARSEIHDLSKQLGKDLEENAKQWDARIDQLLEVQHDYGSLPADFEAQAQHLEIILPERHKLVLATRSRMKALMSEEEWAAVFAER